MKEILDLLYPAGQPNQTYTIEVYGVDGKQYVDVRDDVVYPNPNAQPTSADLEKSRKLYIEYVSKINLVISLQDKYDLGQPLLEETTGVLLPNAVADAAQRIQALFGDPNMNFEGRPAPWNRLIQLNDLAPEHKKLFRQELKNFTTAVSSRGASLRSLSYTVFTQYKFKYPDLGKDINQFQIIPVTYG
jgi:hypothetical protein